MNLARLFHDHPASVGETYFEHMWVALSFAVNLLVTSLILIVHAIAPWLFTDTASATITELYDRMTKRRTDPPKTNGEVIDG